MYFCMQLKMNDQRTANPTRPPWSLLSWFTMGTTVTPELGGVVGGGVVPVLPLEVQTTTGLALKSAQLVGKKERHGNLWLVINAPGCRFKSLRERDGPVFDCVIYSPAAPLMEEHYWWETKMRLPSEGQGIRADLNESGGNMEAITLTWRGLL